MSGVTPHSTTADLAGKVSKEPTREVSTGSSGLPGSFPQTPAKEISDFSVNPIPATSGIGNPVQLAPGEKVPNPSTFTSNTISSTAHDDVSLSKAPEDSQQVYGIAPLPATSGIGNPIHLQPGEKVPNPNTFTDNTIHSTVKTDRESYEKGSAVPQLPDVMTPEKERAAKGGMFSIPGLSKNMIPESSLPMGGASSAEKDPGFTIQSAGAGTTTAALAGNVPLEPRGVPEVVRESQQEAGSAPEASGNREAVREKTAMEKELESKVPEAPPIHEGTTHVHNVNEKSTTAVLAGNVPLEPRGVPEVVQESQKAAGFAPEATANPEAVAEKTAMEKELESKVPEEQPIHNNTIQSAGTNSTTAGLAGNVPLEPKGVPEVVQESQQEAGFAPEATSNPEAVREKSEVEKELESKVPEAPATVGGDSNHSGAMAAGGVAAGGIAAAAVGYGATKAKPAEGSSMLGSRGLPASVQQSINEMNQTTPIAPTVPDVVQESIAESHQSPEAAASKTMVGEKSAMESELLKKVKTEENAGKPAPSSSAALTETAPAATTSAIPTASTAESTQIAEPSSSTTATSAGPSAKSFHAPLASTATPAQPIFPSAMSSAVKQQASSDSRDVSPMSHPKTAGQSQPAVTTGVGSSNAPETSAASPKTSSSPNPASSKVASSPNPSTVTGASTASASTDKKSKRASGFFGKLKSKFSDKEKK